MCTPESDIVLLIKPFILCVPSIHQILYLHCTFVAKSDAYSNNIAVDPSFSWQIIKVEVSIIWERCFLQFSKYLKSKHSLLLALQESYSVAKKRTWGIVN